jgi:hypothetical protein
MREQSRLRFGGNQDPLVFGSFCSPSRRARPGSVQGVLPKSRSAARLPRQSVFATVGPGSNVKICDNPRIHENSFFQPRSFSSRFSIWATRPRHCFLAGMARCAVPSSSEASGRRNQHPKTMRLIPFVPPAERGWDGATRRKIPLCAA